MSVSYADRAEAGRVLAEQVRHLSEARDVLVLGLPRGGLPVAREVARALEAPLDLLVVRKVGLPGQEELAMGAIATGGGEVRNEDVLRGAGVPEATVQQAFEREGAELARRERAYRGERAAPEVAGRTLVLIDDGLATGATMRAAAASLRAGAPERVVVAVPVAPPDTVKRLQAEADEVICPATPSPFGGVGAWYKDFSQTSDEEVQRILDQFATR